MIKEIYINEVFYYLKKQWNKYGDLPPIKAIARIFINYEEYQIKRIIKYMRRQGYLPKTYQFYLDYPKQLSFL